MKTIHLLCVIILFILSSEKLSAQADQSLTTGLLNAATWIDSFDRMITKLTSRPNLSKLNRELRYLSDDLQLMINSKQRLKGTLLTAKETTPGKILVDGHMLDQLREIQESLNTLSRRFDEINEMVPPEFKTTQNHPAIDINQLMQDKQLEMNKMSLLLTGNADRQSLTKETDQMTTISTGIQEKINDLNVKIEEKLK
jgi:hypothetical protein